MNHDTKLAWNKAVTELRLTLIATLCFYITGITSAVMFWVEDNEFQRVSYALIVFANICMTLACDSHRYAIVNYMKALEREA